jgi:hypothetical protein
MATQTITLVPKLTNIEIDSTQLEKQLQAVQEILNKTLEKLNLNFKIKPLDLKQLNINEITGEIKSVLKSFEALQNIAKQGLFENFGIKEKETLKELSALSANWAQQAFQSLQNGESLPPVNEEHINKLIEALKQLNSEANLLHDEYKKFVDYVNNSKIKIEPFGDSDEFKRLRASIGLANVNTKTGLPIDSWYMEARGQFPTILPDVVNIEDQAQALADAVKNAREKIKTSKITEDELRYLFGNPADIEESYKQILNTLLSASGQINEVSTKISDSLNRISDTSIQLEPSKFSDTAGLKVIQDRIEEIRSSVDELARVKIHTTPVINEDGEQLEKITKAVLTYTDSLGRSATETMAWSKTVNEVMGQSVEGVEFGTIATTYDENLQRIKKSAEELSDIHTALQNMVSNLLHGSFSETDTKYLQVYSNQLKEIDLTADGAADSLTLISKAVDDLIAKSKQGIVLENTGLNFKSSKQDITEYVAALKGLTAQQVQVTEKQKDIVTDKATGEQFRKTTVMIEESKNTWREYILTISSLDNTVRQIDNGIQNTTSNLAQRQSVMLARLQNQIDTFKSNSNLKIDNRCRAKN